MTKCTVFHIYHIYVIFIYVYNVQNLFNDFVSNSECIASSDWILLNNESEKMCGLIQALFCNILWDNKKKALKFSVRLGPTQPPVQWIPCLSSSLKPGHYSSLTAPYLQHTANQEWHDQWGNQHHSRELLMMGIVMLETCWAYKKCNNISSDIYLVFLFFSYLNSIFPRVIHYSTNVKRTGRKINLILNLVSVYFLPGKVIYIISYIILLETNCTTSCVFSNSLLQSGRSHV